MKNNEEQKDRNVDKELQNDNKQQKGVLKRYVENNHQCQDGHEIFFFKQKKALTLDTMSKDTNKYIKNVVSTKVKNILYYIIYVFEPRIIEICMVETPFGGVGKAHRN